MSFSVQSGGTASTTMSCSPFARVAEGNGNNGLHRIFHETRPLEVQIAVSPLRGGQGICRGKGRRYDSPPRRGFHSLAACAGASGGRRQTDTDARTSGFQGAACLRLLLSRLPREMVEGSRWNGNSDGTPDQDRRLSDGMDRDGDARTKGLSLCIC